jgi:hypothetical protein
MYIQKVHLVYDCYYLKNMFHDENECNTKHSLDSTTLPETFFDLVSIKLNLSERYAQNFIKNGGI